jgi:hypothetical protein
MLVARFSLRPRLRSDPGIRSYHPFVAVRLWSTKAAKIRRSPFGPPAPQVIVVAPGEQNRARMRERVEGKRGRRCPFDFVYYN